MYLVLETKESLLEWIPRKCIVSNLYSGFFGGDVFEVNVPNYIF